MHGILYNMHIIISFFLNSTFRNYKICIFILHLPINKFFVSIAIGQGFAPTKFHKYTVDSKVIYSTCNYYAIRRGKRLYNVDCVKMK